MNERTENLLNEYLDGTLDADQQTDVEQLLAESVEARAYLAELELLFGDLAKVTEVPLPHDFSQRIVAQIEPAPAPWSNWWLMGQLVGVAVLLLFAWPVLQMGLAELGAALSPNPATLSLSFITQFWQQLRGSLTAVSAPSINLPGLSLESASLTLLLGSAFLVWLLSNGLLLREEIKA